MRRSRLLPLAAALGTLLAGAARAVDTPGTDLWLVTSASVTSGAARFVTSLRIVNPGAAAANVTLRFLAQTPLSGNAALGDNTAGPTAIVVIGAGQTLAIPDVIATKFGGAAVAGGIRVTSDAPVVVMSQTLNVQATSATGVPGAYGFAIPAQTFENAVGPLETATVPYISGSTSSSSGNRTNLFLLSGNETSQSAVHVRLARADGSTVGEQDFLLGKLSQTQVNGIAAAFGSSEANLTAFVTVRSGGPVFLGASVIDNAIGSILYTPPVKSWRPYNAVYPLVLDDGGYGFAGRLDVSGGLPVFLSAGLVVDTCTGATRASLYFVQLGPAYGNATFPPNGDGSYAINGTMANSDGSVGANVTGTIAFTPDGFATGQIVYTRPATAGNPCGGVSKTFPFYGTKAASLVTP